MINVLTLVTIWLGVADMALASLLCSGSSFYRKGIFCNNEQRDVDMLAEAFVEAGLTTEHALASRPAPVIRIVIVQPTQPPPPPTTTTTTTRAPVTTLPPSRRRIANGWAASGADPCEDTNPSDAMDADCYAARFSILKSTIYERLETVSVAADTTRVFQSKLGPLIGQIKVPMVSTGTAAAVAGAVTDLRAATDAAVTQAGTHVTGAQSTTTNMNTAIGAVATAMNNVMKSRFQGAFNNLTLTEIKNINALIKRANFINTNNVAVRGSAALKALVAKVGPLLSLHMDTVIRQKANALAMSRDNITNWMFYKNSNLTALTIPAIYANSTAWGTARRGLMETANRLAVNQIIDLSKISGTNADITAKIASQISLEDSTATSSLAARTADATTAVRRVENQRSGLLDYATTTSNQIVNDIAREAASVNTGPGAIYSQLDTTSNTLISFLNGQGINGIDAWDMSAQRKLANLETLLTDAANALKAAATSAESNGTGSVMSSVLQSLATVGSLQNKINQQLLQRQSANMDAMRDLIQKLQNSGLDFAKLINAISVLKSSLSNSANMNDPDNMFLYFPAAMDKLAQRIGGVAADASAGLGAATNNASAAIGAYSNVMKAFWRDKIRNGFGAQLQQYVTGNVTAAKDDISNTRMFVDQVSETDDTATAGALQMLDKTEDLLTSTDASVDDVAVRMLMDLSAQADSVLLNLGDTNSGFGNQLTNMWSSVKGDVDSRSAMNGFSYSVAADGAKTDFDNELNTLRVVLEKSIDDFNRDNTARNVNPAEQLLSQGMEFNATTLNAADRLRVTQAKALTDISESIAALESDFDLSQIIEFQRQIVTALAQIALGDASTIQLQDFSNRVSKAMSLSSGINSTMRGLSVALRTMDATLQTAPDPVAYISAMMLEAGSIQALLDEEIGVLSGAIADAATLISKAISSLDTGLVVNSTAGLADSWGKAVLDSYKTEIDQIYANGSAWISARAAARPSTDSLLKAEISKDQIFASALNNQFAEDLVSSGTASTALFKALNATVETLNKKISSTGSGRSEITALQGVLGNVAIAVQNSLGASTKQLSSLLSGTASSISSGSASDASALSALSAQADNALAGAGEAVAASSQAADAINSIVAANERERANSAASVMNTLSASAANMQSLLDSAIGDAVKSTDAGSEVQPDLGTFISNMGQQLAGFATLADAQMQQLGQAQADSVQGVESEKLHIKTELQGAANNVLSKTGAVKTTLAGIRTRQAELSDRFDQLVRIATRTDGELDGTSTLIGVDTKAVDALGVDSEAVGRSEVSEMQALESRVDRMIDYGSSA